MRTTPIRLERGAHACHLYRSWAERCNVALPFIAEGLANDEHCIVVTSAESADALRVEMAASGIDAEAEERRHRMQFVTGEAWRGPLAAAGSIVMARDALNMTKALLREFNGVRIVGDVEWDLAPAVSPGALCHWEATANVAFEGSDVRAICQYSVSHYAAGMLHAALRTHPTIIWDGRRWPNPHNEADVILRHEPHLNEPASDRRVVDAILSDLGQHDPFRPRMDGRHN